MTDDEIEDAIHRARVRFGFRCLRATAFTMATLYVVVWINPDLRGPMLTLAILLPFVVAYVIDTLIDMLDPRL